MGGVGLVGGQQHDQLAGHVALRHLFPEAALHEAGSAVRPVRHWRHRHAHLLLGLAWGCATVHGSHLQETGKLCLLQTHTDIHAQAEKNTTCPQANTVSVSVSAQDGIVALGKAHTRSAPSLSSLPKVALETVPIFVWLNTDRSRPWRVECRPLPFSTPLSFRRSML